MEVVKQSEFCGKPPEKGMNVEYIELGTVFRGRLNDSPKHVWLAACSNHLVCVGEPNRYCVVGSYAFTDNMSILERGVQSVKEYEELDAVIVIRD